MRTFDKTATIILFALRRTVKVIIMRFLVPKDQGNLPSQPELDSVMEKQGIIMIYPLAFPPLDLGLGSAPLAEEADNHNNVSWVCSCPRERTPIVVGRGELSIRKPTPTPYFRISVVCARGKRWAIYYSPFPPRIVGSFRSASDIRKRAREGGREGGESTKGSQS